MSGSPGGFPATLSPVVIEDLEKRFTGFKSAEQIDLKTYGNADLRGYGIPPQPDPRNQPLLHGLWMQAFGQRMDLLGYVFNRQRVENARYRLQRRQQEERPAAETRFEASPNWSGAYITASHGLRFTQVWGAWQVPDRLGLPPGPLQGPPDLAYVCSNWIGLDGQRRYIDSTLPQIGTQCQMSLTSDVEAEAWVQWWARNPVDSAPPLPLELPVAPGDSIFCVLTACDAQHVVMVIVNVSAGKGVAVRGAMPSVTLDDGATVTPEIAGATAEWVLERPKIIGETTRYNFPDYGRSGFECCVAVAAEAFGDDALAEGVPQVLSGERYIRMSETLQRPTRTTFISVPRRLNESAIQMRYGSLGPP